MPNPVAPRIRPLKTLGLDSMTELQAFHDASSRRLTPPRVRIALRMPGLDDIERQRHERQLNRLLARRGGREAAIGALLGLVAALAWPLPHAGTDSPIALAAWLGQGAVALATGGLVGTVAGRAIAMRRVVRTCGQLLRGRGARARPGAPGAG
jgi:hypothetical protein